MSTLTRFFIQLTVLEMNGIFFNTAARSAEIKKMKRLKRGTEKSGLKSAAVIWKSCSRDSRTDIIRHFNDCDFLIVFFSSSECDFRTDGAAADDDHVFTQCFIMINRV